MHLSGEEVHVDTVETAKELVKVVRQIAKVDAIRDELEKRQAELVMKLGGRPADEEKA